ncbi:hypothetical protein [Atlantibacter hermannii]|uniref:hypothetical protein n=1 Tax=Atlantibacter hermannii TaxID=565 RepID=UPI0028B0FA32|nr:hypothetical protein [Atlantibacter hermannii]
MKKIQFFVYMVFGLVMILLVFGYVSNFTEPGMSIIPIALSLITSLIWMCVAFISFWWSLTAIPSMSQNYPKLTQKLPKFFNNYLLPVIIILMLAIAGQLNGYATLHQGRNLGFTDIEEFKQSKSKNIFNKNDWLIFKEKVEQEQKLINEENEKNAIEQKKKDYIEGKLYALDKNSSKYLVAEELYKEHGVWIDDFQALQKNVCQREYNKLLNANEASRQAIEIWNQTSDSLRNSGVSPFTGGRSVSTDPEIQRTNDGINFARAELKKCGVAHLNEIENRVTIQRNN